MSELLIRSKQNIDLLSKENNQLENSKTLTETELNYKLNDLNK